MLLKGKPDIIDVIQKKRLQWYGHVKRMPEDRIPKLIMEWIPLERWEGVVGTGWSWLRIGTSGGRLCVR